MHPKLIKANQFGFILRHTDVITPKKSKPKLLSLKDLVVQKLKESVLTDVLKVALASFDFAIKLASLDGQMSTSDVIQYSSGKFKL